MSKKIKLPKLTDDQVNFLKIAGIGLGVYIVFRQLKGVGKDLKEFFTPSKAGQDTIDELKKEVDELKKDGMKPTRSFGQWLIVADTIYNAMKFSAISDNKEVIEKNLKLVQNDLDLALLIEAYGVRQHYAFGFPDGSKTTLVGQIATGELSDKRIKSINDNYKNKGITYRF